MLPAFSGGLPTRAGKSNLVSLTRLARSLPRIQRPQVHLTHQTLDALAADPIAGTILANSGGNQLLLLPAAGGALTAGELRLRCACRHDQGDATAAINHRYDRPVTAILGQGVDEVAELPLVESA